MAAEQNKMPNLTPRKEDTYDADWAHEFLGKRSPGWTPQKRDEYRKKRLEEAEQKNKGVRRQRSEDSWHDDLL